MVTRILNIVGWIGTGLVLAALGIRIGLPAQDQYAFYLAWAGLVCVLAYILSQWRTIVASFGKRQMRYGALTSLSVIVVLAIIVAINYIGKRQSKRWDLTASKQFSLSDQTRNILQKLDAPLHIRAFAKEVDLQGFRDRLKEYEYTSKQVTTEYIDPDKKPAVAQQNQVTAYGTIVFEYKGRSERITSNSEQDITNGVIKVVTGQQRKVYFTVGHGEKDTAATDRSGYSTITEGLKGENYTLDKLALAQQSAVPADSAVVVVAGPKVDFLAPEVDALKAYLEKGGKVFLALDPPERADAPPLANLIALAHDWGMDVGNNVVVDVSGVGRLFGASEAVPVAVNYPAHAITERFNVMTAYPLARSITAVSGGVNDHIAQAVVETGPQSWAETDLKGLFASTPMEMNAASGDKQGPVAIAAAVSASVASPSAEPGKDDAPKAEARMVVFGDSDFASNATIGLSGNRDLFMNTVGWLSQQENLIAIRPKEADDRRLTLNSAQQTNINLIALFGIPAAIFGLGIRSWWRRR